jgi:site-specific DNA-methyltransferase (adenine-specific)
MKNIPDESVDFILCDLPYQQTACKWDVKIEKTKLWEEYNRIIKKDGTIALFGSQPFTTELINSNLKDFKYCWYWIKNQGTNFFHAKKMPIRKVEEICIFKNGNYYPQITEGHLPTKSAKGCSNGKTYNGEKKRNYEGGKTTRFPTNILDFKCVDNYSRLHSSEKPIDLLKYFIKTYTIEGQVVLDNTMGSCSTGESCVDTNRNFIGIEDDEISFDIAVNRMIKKQITHNIELIIE